VTAVLLVADSYEILSHCAGFVYFGAVHLPLLIAATIPPLSLAQLSHD